VNQSCLFVATGTRSESLAKELVDVSREHGEAVSHVFRGRRDGRDDFVVYTGPGISLQDDEPAVDSFLTTGVCALDGNRQRTFGIWEADPEFADINVFVMAFGPLRFARECPHVRSSLRHRFEGDRDCFMVWSDEMRAIGGRDAYHAVDDGTLGAGTSDLFFSYKLAVQGVAYMREVMYDESGNASEVTRFVRIRAKRLLAVDGANDFEEFDVIKFNVEVHERPSSMGFHESEPLFDGWRAQADAAVRGFRRFCAVNNVVQGPVRDRPRRRSFLPPQAPRTARRFEALVRNLPIGDALEAVESTEELAALAEMHRASRLVPLQDVVEEMVHRHAGSDELADRLAGLSEELAKSA
jgi:hypothetical protein